jgi:hypothetical protein
LLEVVMLRRRILAIALLGATGCGGSSSVPPPPPDTLFSTAPHMPLPQVNAHSGTVLHAVKLVTITYSGDKNLPTDVTFDRFVVTSNWISTIGADYGVGPGTVAAEKTFPPASMSLTASQLVSTLESNMMTGALPVPTAGDGSLYAVFIPHGVQFNEDILGLGPLCGSYLGYHNSANYNGVPFAFAVIGDCYGRAKDVQAVASHEIAEACTDPYDAPQDGYYIDLNPPNPWTIDLGEEVGDLCQSENVVTEGNYTLQTIWSNSAAKIGNPCVPPPEPTYYNVSATPDAPTVAAGSTVTYTLTGWSTAPVPDWGLAAGDAKNSQLSAVTLSPQFSSFTINNGQQVMLTLTVPAGTPSGTVGGLILQSGALQHYWPVMFVVQ